MDMDEFDELDGMWKEQLRRIRASYILDEQHNVIETDLLTWAQWFEQTEHRVVARDVLHDGRIVVSTVFMGIDHNFMFRGPPLLFETMVFHHDKGEDCYRYATWDEAEKGHNEVVAALMVRHN